MLILAISLWLCRQVLGGDIIPDPIDYLSLTTSAALQSSRYVFRFHLSTKLLSPCQLTIQFPLQFLPGLGLTHPSCFSHLLEAPLSVSCSVSSRTVSFQLPDLPAGLQVFGIYSVLNPLQNGGTGNFQVHTYLNGLLQDANDAYPPIGISPAPASLQATMTAQGNLYAGYSPLYILRLSLSQSLSGVWVRITWPAQYTVPGGLKCYSEESASYFACESFEPWSRYMHLYPESLPASATLRIFNQHNPAYSCHTDTLLVEVLALGGFQTLLVSPPLPGFNITPGPITNVKVQGSPLNHNLLVWYQVSFTTFNPVPQGGTIQLVFPSEFQGTFDCGVVNALKTLAGQLVCQTSGNVATFENFEYLLAGQAVVQVQAKNPATAAVSSQFVVQSFDSSSRMVDQSLFSDVLTFSSISAPNLVQVDMFRPRTETPFASYGPLELYLQTRTLLPPTLGSTQGMIQITCPVAVLTDGSVMPAQSQLSCLFGKKRVPASSCVLTAANVIQVGTPASEGLECCPLALTITTIGKPTSASYGFHLDYHFPGLQRFVIAVFINGVKEEEQVYYYRPAPKSLFSSSGVPAAGGLTASFMHRTTGMPNYVKFTLLPSVIIPAGGSVEFEFTTNGGGWARDLGWGLRSFQSTNYPCVYDLVDGMTFSSCTVVAGTTISSAFIRLTGMTSALTVASRTFYFAQVTNGQVAGVTQQVTVRTITSDTVVVEEGVLSANVLTDDLKPPSPNITGVNSAISILNHSISALNADATHLIWLNSDLHPGDGLLIIYPQDYHWPYGPTSMASVACTAGVGLGSLSDYLTLTNFGGNAFVYIASTPTTVASLGGPQQLSACLRLPQDVWTATITYVNIYLVQNFKVTEYGTLQVPAPVGGGGAFSIAELLRDTSRHLQRTHTLYQLTFQISSPIAAGAPELAFLFPTTAFTSLAADFFCYSLILAPTGTQCATAFGISYGGNSYSAVSLTNIPTPIMLGTQFKVQVWATTVAVAGPVTLYGMSCSMPCPTGPVDVFSTSLTLDVVSVPASILPRQLLTPLIQTRAAESGPLNFTLKPMTNIPYATSTSKPYLQVTFPQAAAFTYDPAAYLECRFDGVLSSYCELLPGPPLVLKAYSPSTPAGGMLAANTNHHLVVTTRDYTLFPGFQAPIPGNYLFIIESRDDSLPAAIEQTESWVTVLPPRLYQASITSMCKGAAQWNALLFSFQVPVSVASSTTGPVRGAVWMQFPTNPVTPGNAWLPDFGAGFSDVAPVDCVNSGSTVSLTTSGGKFSCLLVYGGQTYFFVKLTGFDAVNAGDKFTFYLGPVKNPASTLIDLAIEITIKEENLSNPANPVWTSKAEVTVAYIDTTLTVPAPSVGSDGAGANNLFTGSPAISTLGATLQLNIANSVALLTGDSIFISLGPGFAPQTLTCSVLPGPVVVPTCVGFPVNGWILVKAPMSLPIMPSTSYYSLKAVGINLPGWGGSIVMTSYYYRDRKLAQSLQHPDFATSAHDLTKGNCALTTSLLQSKLQGYPDTYSFSFSCAHDISKTGHIGLIFPGAIFSAVILPLSCAVGPGSGIPLTSLTCVQSGFEVDISGLQTNVLASTPLQLLVSVTANPPNTTYPVTTYQGFKVQTYHSTDNSQPVDQGTDNVGVSVQWIVTASKVSSFALGAEPVFHSFHDYVTTASNLGPLSLTMSLPAGSTLVHNTGVLKILSYSGLSYSGELLCVWVQSGSEYLASTCSLAANLVTMKAPKQFDISSPFSVLITTKHAAVEDGLSWTGGEGTYTLDLSVDVNGDGIVDAQWRTSVEVRPPFVPTMSVLYDHVNVNLRNRLQLSFQHSADIPDSVTNHCRLIVELPSVLSYNLGLGTDNFPVSCKAEAGLTVKAPYPAIACYLRVGSASQPARIIVTGFDTILANTLVQMHFDKIMHPAAGGDDKIVSVTLVVADVSAGWPGVRLAARTIDYLYSLQVWPTPATPVPANGFQMVANSQVGASNGQYKIPLVAPTGNFLSGDLYVIQLDSRVSIGTPGCSPNASCVYYPGSNSLFITLAVGASTTFDLTITGFQNTSYLLQTGLTATAILVRSHRCIQTVNYPLSLAPFFTPGSLTAMSVSRLDTVATNYQSDQTDLLLKFTTAVPVLATGAIRITLPADFSAGSTTCFNYPAVSLLTGVITCSYTAPSFSITGFNALPALSAVALIINVVNPATSGAVSITVTTVHSSTNLNEVMDIGTTSLTLDTHVAPTYHQVPLQFHVPREVRAGSVAPFQTYLNFEYAFTPTTALTLTFTFPAISLAPGGQLICFIAGTLYPCTLAGSTFTFTTASTLAAGRYLVLITTRLADSYEGNGLQYPAAGSYTVTFAFNDGTHNYFVDDIYVVLPTNRFSTLVVSAGQAAVNSMNSFTVNLQFNTAADELQVCFPTNDPLQNSLFANDLGTGVDDSAALPCTPTGLTLTGSFTCRLNYGAQSIARPACIQVLNFSVASGTSASIIFDGIQNPPQAVSDSTHVHISVYAYLASTLNTAQTFYDVFTLSWAAPVTLTHTNSSPVGAYETTFSVDLPTQCQSTDICVIVLPSLMAATTTATCTAGSSCVGRTRSLWFVCKSNGNLSSLAVTLSANAIPYTTPTMVAMYYLWQKNSYGVYTATYQYAITLPPAFDPRNNVVSGPTFGWPSTTLPANTVVWYNFAYTLAHVLPASGCIQFTLPSAVTVASTYCFANGDSTADFYKVTTNPQAQCLAAGSTLTIRGFDALSPNSVASVSVAISTTTTLSIVKQVVFQSFYNSLCTFPIECDDGTNNYNNYNLSTSLDIPTEVSLERALSPVTTASKGSNAIIRFRLNPQTSLTLAATSSLQLTFQDTPTLPAGSTLYCDIMNMSNRVRTIATCTLVASVLSITPSIAISTGSTYEVLAYTQGVEGVVGLTLPNSNTQSSVTFKTYNSGTFADFSVFYFSIPSSTLTNLFVWPMHTTLLEMNMFSVSFTSNVATGTYNVVVEFPCQTETVPPIPLFDDCLGTGSSSGTVLPCMTWTPNYTASNSVLTNCLLYCGKCPFMPPRVRYQSVAITNGSSVHFSVAQIYNPNILAANWDQAIVHIRVFVEDVSSGLVYAEGTVWNLFSVELHPPAAFSTLSADLQNSNNVGAHKTDQLKITYSGTPNFGTPYSVSGYLLTSANIIFNPPSCTPATCCASAYCNFPNNHLAWATGSNSPLIGTPVAPWLSVSQGTIDYLIVVGAPSGNNFQSFAMYKKTNLVVHAISKVGIDINRYFTYYGKNTWQFNRFFMKAPLDLDSTYYIDIYLVSNGGDNADEDEEFIEFTDNWPANPPKWKFSGGHFRVYDLPSISSGTTLGFRFLLKTTNASPSNTYWEIYAPLGLVAADNTQDNLYEDPLGGYDTNPTVTYTTDFKQLTFAFKLNWQFDGFACVSGLTRVNLMDWPFHSLFNAANPTDCTYPGLDICDNCNGNEASFKSGVEMVADLNQKTNASSANDHSPVSLQLKLGNAVSPGWNSIGITVPSDAWNYHCGNCNGGCGGGRNGGCESCDIPKNSSGKSNNSGFSGGCGDPKNGHCQFPNDCHTNTYWASKPNDAVAVIFTKIPVSSVATITANMYSRNSSSVSGVYIDVTLPAAVVAGSVFRFGFQGFPSALGYSPGDPVPYVDVIGGNTDSCWATAAYTGTMSLVYINPPPGTSTPPYYYSYSAVWCQTIKAVATYKVHFPYIQTPASGDHLYIVQVWSLTSGGYQITAEYYGAAAANQIYVNADFIAAVAPTATSVTLTSTVASAQNSVSLVFPATSNYAVGDIILIDLGYASGAPGLTFSASPTATFVQIASGGVCPCLMATFTAAGGTSATITINNVPNPGYVVVPQMTGYAHQLPTAERKSYKVVFSFSSVTPSVASGFTLTPVSPPMYPNEEILFSLQFTLGGAIGSPGLIQLTFPLALFADVRGTPAVTDAPGAPLSFSSSVVGANTVVSVTGNSQSILAGTTLHITTMWAKLPVSPVNSSISVQSYTIVGGTNYVTDNPLSTVVTVTGTYMYLSSSNLWFPPAFRTGQFTPNGPSEKGVLSLYFQVPTALASTWGQFSNPADVQLSFAFNTFVPVCTYMYGVFTNSAWQVFGGYGPIVSLGNASTPTTYQVGVPINIAIPAASLWRVEIGCYNGGIGLVMDLNNLVDVEVDEVGSGKKYLQPELVFPIGGRFTSVAIRPSAINTSVESYFTITFKPSSAETDGTQLVVQFPTVDILSGVQIFQPSLGYGLPEDAQVPCTLYQGATLQAGSFCRFFPGGSGSNIEQYRKEPRVVLYMAGMNLVAGTAYTWVIGGFLNPALTALRTDLTVYTRFKWTSSHVNRGDGIYQYVNYAYIRPMMTTITQATTAGHDLYQTSISATLVTTTNISFQLGNAAGPSALDFFVFKFPWMLAVLPTSALTATAIGTYQVYLMPVAGYIAVFPSAQVAAGASAAVFSFAGLNNPPYLMTSWTLASVVLSSVFYSSQCNVKSLVYDQSPPSPLYTIITTLAPTLVPQYSRMSTNYSIKHTFAVTVPGITIPTSGCLEVAMPAGYQSVGSVCGVSINNFAYSADCTVAPGTWKVLNFNQNIPPGTTFQVFGTCLSPAAIGTQSLSVSVWADVAKTQELASGAGVTALFVSDNRHQDPADLLLLPQTLSKQLIRSLDYGAVYLTFQPSIKVPMSNGSVTVTVAPVTTFVYTAGNSYLVCKFIDSVSLLEYRGGSCGFAANTFTATAPPNTDLSTASTYTLRIYTTGRDPPTSENGLPYPDITSTKSAQWTLTTLSSATVINRFTDLMRINPLYSTFGTFKAYPISRHAGDNCVFQVLLNWSIAVGQGVTIVFPTPLYPSDAGTGLQMDSNAACDYSPSVLNTGGTKASCLLRPELYANMSPRSARFELQSPAATTGAVNYYLPGITNPGVNSNVSVLAAVYQTLGSIEALVYIGVIYNVFEVKPTYVPVGPVLEDSLTNHMSTLSVSAASTSYLLISAGVPANSYVLFSFPLPMRPGTTISNQFTAHNPVKQLLAVPSAAVPGTFHWAVSDLLNPPYVTTDPPITAVIYANGYYVTSISFSNNAQPYAVGSGFTASDTTYNSGQRVVGVDFPLLLTFSLPVALPSGSGFVLTFTSGTPDPFCEVVDSNLPLVIGDFVSCQVTALKMYLTNLGTYVANTNVDVSVWLTAAAPIAFGFQVYLDGGTWAQLMWTASYTSPGAFVSPTLLSGVSAVTPVSKYKVIRSGVYSPLRFNINLVTLLTHNSGTFTLTFPLGSLGYDASIAVASDLRAVWVSATTVYLGKSCTWTSAASITVTAMAPEVTDIAAASSWTLILTTVNQNNREGLQNPSAFNTGQIWVYGAGNSLGTTATDYGGALMTVVPADFSLGWAETYSLTPNQYSGFRLNFTPSANLANGFESGGTTEIVLQIGKSTFVLPSNLGGLANPGTYNYGQTDCFPTAGLATMKCYIQNGSTSGPPQVWIRQFAAVTSGTASQFSILPVMNSATKGQMLHLRLFTRIYSAPIWTFTQYRELNFAYMTEDSTVTTQPVQTVTLSDWRPQTVSSVTWTVQTSGALATTGLDGVLLQLTSHSHLLAGASVTANTLRVLAVNYMYFVQPGAAFASPVTVNSVPTAAYCMNKQWNAFVFAGAYLTDTMTYTLFTDCTDYVDSATATISRFSDLNVPNPLVSRTDVYQMAFQPSVIVPSGGEIIIGVPAAYTLGTYCEVVCGLTGFIQCVASGSTYVITGFDQYSFAVTNLYVLLTFSLTAQSTPVTATPFTLHIYAVNSVLTAHTEIASFGSFSIVAAPTTPIFTASLNPLYWEQVCAYLLGFAHFYVDFKPSMAYTYGTVLYVDLPAGSTLVSPTVVECSITNGVNVVPSEGGCSVLTAASPVSLLVTIPEQLQPSVGATTYTLIVKVRDSGTLANDGLQLPSATDIQASSGNPSALYWYWHLMSGATIVEAAKFGWQFCGRPYVSVHVGTGHGLLSEWNFFDVTLKSDFSVPVAGAVVVEFATNNELSPLFSVDLGLGASTTVDCAPIAGYGLPTPLTMACTLMPATLQSTLTPAVVQVTSSVVLPSSTTHALRMVRLKNPLVQVDPLFGKQLLVHFRVYMYSALDATGFLLNDAICYRVFNANTLYSIPLATVRFGTALITGPSPPNLTLTLITPPNYIEYSFGSNSATAIGSNSGAIIFVLDSSFSLSTSGTSLTPTLCSVFSTCSFSVHDLSKWIVMTVTGAANTPLTTTNVDFTSINTPSSSVLAGYLVEAHILSGIQRWTDTYSASLPTVNPRPATTPVSVNPESLPNRNTYRIFTIPIDMTGVPSTVVRVDYVFPREFQWVDAVCVSYTNLVRRTGPGATGDVVCRSDCSAQVCTNRVTITNFKLTTGATSFTFKIRAMNPVNEGTTSPAQLFYYNSQTDTTQVAQQSLSAGTYAILHPTYSFDVWLYWPTQDVYSRTVKTGEMGEIVLRLQSSVFTPPSTGRLEIVLPESFDIAPQGTPVCTLGYGDMPFDNFPWLPWIYGYSHVPSSLCTWEGRVVVARFPDILLRQFYGVGGSCAFIVLSTTGSATNGFRAPMLPGYYDLQVYAKDGTYTVLEAAFPQIQVSGPFMPSDFTVFGPVKDAGALTNIGFQFTSTVLIPPGYAYLTQDGRPGIVSNMEVDFTTYQGFAPDLATGLQTGSQVPCYAAAGLVVHGNSLICTLTLGDLTLSTPSPTRLTISGYEQIAPGTFIQIVIPKVQNPLSALAADPTLLQLVATLTVGVYITDLQGQVTWLYAPTAQSSYVVTLTTVVSTSKVIAGASGQQLDSLLQLQLPFTLPTASAANDLIIIDFPPHFTNLPANIVLGVYASPSNVPVLSSLPVVLYAAVMRLVGTFTVPLAASTNYYFRLDNIRLPQFMDVTLPIAITYFTVQSHYIGASFTIPDLFATLSVQPAAFQNAVAQVDKPYAKEVYVTLTFTASLMAYLPAGSAIVAGLPSDFPSLLLSSPAPTCSSSLAAPCTVSYLSVTVADFGALPRNQVFSITITGVKAPAVAGTTQPLQLRAYTAAAQQIASTSLPGLLFAPPRLPLSVDLSFTPQFQVAGVVNVFSLELMRPALVVPPQTLIELTIPTAFNITQSLQCQYMKGFQTNPPCVAYDSYRIRIVLQNSVPVTSSIEVWFQGITSPRITGLQSVTYTGLAVTLTYDSTVLLTTSLGSITLGPPPAALSVLQQSLTPSNEAEYALHNLTLQLPVELPGDPDFGLLLKYPPEFISDLTPTDIVLTCTTEPKARSCVYVYPRQILITGFEELVSAYFNVTLSLFGLNNPPLGGTGQLSIYALQVSTRNVLTFTEAGGSFNLTRTPSALQVLSFNSSVPTISSRADYAFAFNTASNTLTSGVVWVDWPETVRTILTANVTTCEGPGGVGLSCQWEMLTGRKRITLSDSAISLANQNVSFVLRRLQTPRIAGPTPLYSLRLFDWTKVTSRSYHNLYGNDYLSFVGGNYSVEIPVDLPWGIIKGTYSDIFHLQLGLATYYQVTIVPLPDYSVLAVSPPSFFFQYIYDFSTSFRVGAPANSTTGAYSIYFTKYENSSSQAEIYSAVPEIPIQVIDPNASLPVHIGDIAPLTVDALSLPITIDLDNPPFEELVITPWTSPPQGELVQILPAAIHFAAGEMHKTFQLRVSLGATSGSVHYALNGTSAAAYYLSTNVSYFSLSAPPYVPVTVLSLSTNDLNRTSAKFSARFTGPVRALYLCAPAGTPQPSPQQLFSKSQLIATVPLIYGEMYVEAYEKVAEIVVSGLMDDYQYVLYVGGQDLRGNLVAGVQQLTFRTLPSPPPATFSIQMTKLVSKQTVQRAVATALAVPETLVASRGIDPAVFSTGKGRNLEIMPLKYDLILIANRTKEDPKPLKLVLQLDSHMQIVQKYLPAIDPSVSIAATAAEYKRARMKVEDVNITFVTGTSISANLTLNTDGVIYAAVVLASAGNCLGQQLIAGLDPGNQRIAQGKWAQCNYVFGYPCVANFSGLQNGEKYKLWVSGETDVPGHYDLMRDYDMREVELVDTVKDRLQGVLITMKDRATVLVAWTLLSLS